MWAILSPYLIKIGISLAMSLLQGGISLAKKTGLISSLEADGIQIGAHVIQATKIEHTYPEQIHRDGV